MKLVRKINRRVGDKEYYKWSVDITPQLMEELGWKPGTPLQGVVSGDTLLLRPLEE